MPRGKSSKNGDRFIAANGYEYVKERGEWISLHRKIAGDKLGRPLRPGERVKFLDGDRTNLDPNNLKVLKAKTNEDRIAWLKEKIRQYQEELAELQR